MGIILLTYYQEPRVTRDVLVWDLIDLFSKPLLPYRIEESLVNSYQLEIHESLLEKKIGRVVLFESDARTFSWTSNSLLSSQ